MCLVVGKWGLIQGGIGDFRRLLGGKSGMGGGDSPRAALCLTVLSITMLLCHQTKSTMTDLQHQPNRNPYS